MGADTKALRSRIRSVDSTLHLTRAMGLVASSKIRRSLDRMRNARSYADAVEGLVRELSAFPECRRGVFCRAGGERTRLVVIAGDRSLCGGYNANVFRLAATHPDAEILPIGKRAHERFGGTFLSSEHLSREEGYGLAVRLCREFAAGEYDRLVILSTRFRSMLSQEPILTEVLPLSVKAEAAPGSLLFEPDAETVLDAAVPEYVFAVLMAAVRESFASEVAARRMAMDNADKNATQMIADLQLAYNRARQSAITQEITEIVAGSGE